MQAAVPRPGGGSQRFGIFRDPGPPTKHTGGRRATRWAIVTVMAAMVTLLMLLVLIDFTRSEKNAKRKSSNATTPIRRQFNDPPGEPGPRGRSLRERLGADPDNEPPPPPPPPPPSPPSSPPPTAPSTPRESPDDPSSSEAAQPLRESDAPVQNELRAEPRVALPTQRRHFFSDLGTFQGEQVFLPEAPVHLEPRKLNKQWPILGHPSQHLVVNNKGVIIPHSVNFPELVKAYNYPQLQSYKNYQSSLGAKKLQDVINYLASKGVGYRPRVLPVPQLPEYGPFMPSEKVAGADEQPDALYNGHAYIADPFHPYKPSDPVEINEMASSTGTDRTRHPLFGEEASESLHILTRTHPKATRARYPFLHPGGPQYTEATFKPLGSSAVGQRAPPLSVMLEIYPMAAGMTPTIDAATLKVPLRLQSDASVSKPLLTAPAPALAPAPWRYPMMQGLLSPPNRAPAYGVTLSGIQALPLPDHKHRMVVLLNFYPKKAVRLSDAATEPAHKGAALLPGGTFSQRRQSHVPPPLPISLALDLAPLVRSLPRRVRQLLLAILRTGVQDSDREDEYVDEYNDDQDSDSGERPGLVHDVDAKPSEEIDDSEDHLGDPGELADGDAADFYRRPPTKHSLLSRTASRGGHTPSNADRLSYFDVQEEDDEDITGRDARKEGRMKERRKDEGREGEREGGREGGM